MMYHDNTNQKKPGVTILISDKPDFRTSKIIKNKETFYIIINRAILRKT